MPATKTEKGRRCVNSPPPARKDGPPMQEDPSRTKLCGRCGTAFTRRTGYSNAQWAKAKYCGNSCAWKAQERVMPLCACGCKQPLANRQTLHRLGHGRGLRVNVIHFLNKKNGRWMVLDRDGKPHLWARVVMAGKLGRSLRSGEVVHHINRDKTDDRPENLEVHESQSAHLKSHIEAGDFPQCQPKDRAS